jgi:hypothetical protein
LGFKENVCVSIFIALGKRSDAVHPVASPLEALRDETTRCQLKKEHFPRDATAEVRQHQ